jgi:outer membrane lipopolysaccharide assembly protein LptE/RlpB
MRQYICMRKALILLLSPLAFLAGCGYHVAGTATHLPPNVRTLAVPIFTNNALAYHTNVTLTDAVIHELNLRTKLRITPAENTTNADAILHGTVLTEVILPLTYDSSTGASSSFLVTITASVQLEDANGRVLYKNDKYIFRQQYQSTQDLPSFIREESPAELRLARDFASTLVGDILDSF